MGVVFFCSIFEKKNRLVEVLPLDHILLESDSPALGPDRNVCIHELYNNNNNNNAVLLHDGLPSEDHLD